MRDETELHKIAFVLKCGETTCFQERVRCQFYGVQRFGAISVCILFNKELRNQDGEPSGPGWLQRLPECLDAE